MVLDRAEADEAQAGGTGAGGESGTITSVTEVRSTDLDVIGDASARYEHRIFMIVVLEREPSVFPTVSV